MIVCMSAGAAEDLRLLVILEMQRRQDHACRNNSLPRLQHLTARTDWCSKVHKPVRAEEKRRPGH